MSWTTGAWVKVQATEEIGQVIGRRNGRLELSDGVKTWECEESALTWASQAEMERAGFWKKAPK